jgi:hypothetical protein
MYEGPYAADEYPLLKVCDLAAMEIGWILELSSEPQSKWTAEQWSRFRAEVRKALAAKFRGNK